VPRRTGRPIPVDQGFTLVEVIIAIVLLAMVSVSMLGLFVRAMKDSTGLDRRQAAVAVASQAMELARSIPAVQQDSSHNSKLTGGRTQTAVNAQWAAASAADLSQTDESWDTNATVSSVPVLPLTSTSAVAGVTYTATNLVGTCWRDPGTNACIKALSPSSPLTTPPTASSVLMYRVIVLVTWSEGAGTTCSGSACSYALATLVDPGTDPPFNLNATNASWPAAPVVKPLSVSVAENSSIVVDLQSAVTNGATSLVASITSGAAITNGTATVMPNTTNLTVTPATNFASGPDIAVPFTLTDPYGQSASSTLSVHVVGPLTASDFTVTVQRGKSLTIDLAPYIANGTGTLTYSVTASVTSQADVSISGSIVTYSRKNSSNTSQDSFTYTVVSSNGQQDSGVVSVLVI
jgi:prepilin-type N-terminal cleavage/methylation domain-containing protein